jgi:phenylpyruvate tautomerase PptA (4-oxalocrotonate tautomerase family)
MPLVRIDIRARPEAGFARSVGAVVYQALRSSINVPEHDNFQILTQHDEQGFVYDPQYLGIARSDALVIIQITLSEGRTLEQKKLLYRSIAQGLHQQLGVPLADVFVSLVEVKKENWSFGEGIAQYAT